VSTNSGQVQDEVSPFTEDEVESLLKASEGWERSLLSVCIFTGMRRGEVLGLRWSGVFFDRDRILVRRSLTRHGESSPKSKTSFRYVQMLPRVREELLKQRDRVKLRSEFVFPNRAWKALNVNWVTKALWPRLVEKAEVPYRPLMQTRHTYATLMLQKGAPIDWLQKQMGHRNLTMLIRHYWRWINPGELSQETLARLGAVKNSSNQPHPDPTRANQGVSREA
jgi:integrase